MLFELILWFGFASIIAGILFVITSAIRNSQTHFWYEAVPKKQFFIAVKPHICPKNVSFTPVARTRHVSIGDGPMMPVSIVDPMGSSVIPIPREKGAVICDGVFCSECQQRLACRCGKTPVRDTILQSQEELHAVIFCCETPFMVESNLPDSPHTFRWRKRSQKEKTYLS